MSRNTAGIVAALLYVYLQFVFPNPNAFVSGIGGDSRHANQHREENIEKQLSRKGLDALFARAYLHPTTKRDGEGDVNE